MKGPMKCLLTQLGIIQNWATICLNVKCLALLCFYIIVRLALQSKVSILAEDLSEGWYLCCAHTVHMCKSCLL